MGEHARYALPPTPDNEEERLRALKKFNILNTAPEETFDRITSLAADIFQAPIALITFVDRHRQWFKSRIGLDATETARDLAFCAHAILSDDLLIIADTHEDPRFAGHPAVIDEPFVRFYAGAPLITSDRHRLGTLCIADREPRPLLTPTQQRMLRNLASLVVREMEIRIIAARDAAMAGAKPPRK